MPFYEVQQGKALCTLPRAALAAYTADTHMREKVTLLLTTTRATAESKESIAVIVHLRDVSSSRYSVC